MILLTLGLVLLPCALYYYFTRNFGYWKKRNVVSRTPVPFFGNLYESAMRKKTLSEVFRGIYKEFPKEKVVGLYRMTTPALLIRDLDVIKHVMIKDFDLFVDRGFSFSNEGLGNNLFHADPETWKVLRSKFTPIFTTGKLKNMLHLMVERGDKFIDYVDGETAVKTEHDVMGLLQKYFMAVISACAFGLDLQYTDRELETLNEIDKAMFNLNYSNEINMLFPGILKKFDLSIVPKFVISFFNNLVSDVMKQRDNKPSNRKDFMDLIMELKQQGNVQGPKRDNQMHQSELEITDSVIAAQAFIFYAAGYETSSSTLTWLLYQLALNPGIQEKLQTEIDCVLAKHNGEVSYDALQEMEYLEKVFNETLRMYPVVDGIAGIQRVAQENYEVPGTDIVVDKGTLLLVSAFGIHHDEEIWPNPHIFDPERFSPEKVRERHPCSFVGFGIGNRNCIGMRFSKVSSRVCLIKLLSKYNLELSKNTPKQIKFDATRVMVCPDGGMPLNVIRRTKKTVT